MVVVPKRGLAIAVCPFQRGAARSRIDRGASPGGTRVLFTSRMRALAARPVQAPSSARKGSGIAAAA
jgi:hypothetical protein